MEEEEVFFQLYLLGVVVLPLGGLVPRLFMPWVEVVVAEAVCS